jgi:PIN domain nuclease of toxin-antitoxin system
MKLLLDTHAFLWLNQEPEKLSTAVMTALQDDENEIFLSLVSVWEIQIKQQLGKLELKTDLLSILRLHTEMNTIQLLSMQLPHILGLQDLPAHHKDPFDRLLIAQARIENLTMISSDQYFSMYPIRLLW